MATTTTTTMGQTRASNEAANRKMYWGIAIAIIAALAIIFATRASRNDVVTESTTTTAPATVTDTARTTTTAPATITNTARTTTTDSTIPTTDGAAAGGVNAGAARNESNGYNVDNGTMDLKNQPNDRLTTPNAANPNPSK
ncbi:MAG: hypothetical protein H7328_00815 [Bdellovibrio sp.]|nr:hypothetical protein [Bdellovibrio sp.]